ncbi:uncharacterized protein LOC130055086 [Ostrea edulis]|uniref:uncharacterized protein LOC130055086 n=1 Tax=Ostrea edulis TaxID=37623 RepID=UPI0024AFBED4|nr:uncharacterized protein LOC130055086 [Ostrea edulis]
MSGFLQVRNRYPDSRLLLAQQMSHRPNTQDQFYHLTQQKEDSVAMVGVISHVMRAKRTTGQAEALEDQPGPSGPIFEEVEEEDETLSLTATTSNESPEVQHTPLRLKVLSPSPADISSHGRRLFFEEEAKFLINECHHLISDPNCSITSVACARVLEQTPEGRAIPSRLKGVDPKGYLKRISDRVRTAQRNLRRKDLP